MIKRHAKLACFTMFLLIAPISLGLAEEPRSGEPVNGLQLSIATNQSTWVLGEPITIEATLRNVGDHAIVDAFGDLQETFAPTHAISWASHTWGLNFEEPGTGKPVLGPTTTHRGVRKVSQGQFVYLEPNQTFVKHLTYTLTSFPAGRYTTYVAYHPSVITHPMLEEEVRKFGFTPWQGSVRSNSITIEVVEAR